MCQQPDTYRQVGRLLRGEPKQHLLYGHSEELGEVVDNLLAKELLVVHGRQAKADNEHLSSDVLHGARATLHPVQRVLVEPQVVFSHCLVLHGWHVLVWEVLCPCEESAEGWGGERERELSDHSDAMYTSCVHIFDSAKHKLFLFCPTGYCMNAVENFYVCSLMSITPYTSHRQGNLI